MHYLLRGTPGFICVAALGTAEEALERLPVLKPEVVLLDIHLPGISGIDCIARLKRLLPETRVMMLTTFEDHDRIFDSLRRGANGYLLKKTPPAKLLEAITELHNGGAPMSAPIARQVVAAFHSQPPQIDGAGRLSPREEEVLHLLNQGFLYKEVADRLNISLGTVRTYIGRIYEKLEVNSRAQAMVKVQAKTLH